MRKLQQEAYEVLYQRAEEAAHLLFYQLQEEISNIVMIWYSNNTGKNSAAVVFNDAEDLENRGVYGSAPGLYLSLEGGDIEIHLPKTTYKYGEYLEAIEELHEADDDVYYETIPNMIDVLYDGEENLEIDFVCNIVGLPISEAYVSARVLAEELVQMLNGIKVFNQVEYHEGDDDGKINWDKNPNNYFVGVKLYCNIMDMR